MVDSVLSDSEASGVRAIVLPAVEGALLLPGAMLAEVIPCESLDVSPEPPVWMLGRTQWRDRRIPVVWFSKGGAGTDGSTHSAGIPAPRTLKLAVVYALNAQSGFDFYGIACTAVPRPVTASERSVRSSASAGQELWPFLAQAVRVDGEAAFIPDFDALETALGEVAASGATSGIDAANQAAAG